MIGHSRYDPSNRIIWIRGIPPIDFWVRREGMIRELIAKYALKPMDTSGFQFGALAEVAEAKTEKAAMSFRRPPFPGGMRIPHLHFEGNVYALNDQQWQAFAGNVVKGLSEKLGKASALSFDDVRDLAGEIDKFG